MRAGETHTRIGGGGGTRMDGSGGTRMDGGGGTQMDGGSTQIRRGVAAPRQMVVLKS